jgi:raffinose/stachyose/melibiose transport system substrate-binding protein
MMNRRKGILTVAALSALGLAASSTATPAAASAEPQTLVVQTSSYFAPTMEAVGALLEEQYPGLTIEYQQITGEQEMTTNLQLLASDEAPDVGNAPINGPVYTELVQAGELLPLDDVWEAAGLAEGYGPELAESLMFDGTPYSVNISRVLYGIAWYDKDIFAEVGIAEPENHEIGTYEELLSITQALRDGGYQPLLIPGGGAEYWNWLVDVFLPTSASPEQFRNYATNFNPAVEITASYTDPEFTAVFDRLKQMYDDQMFQDGILGMDKAATDALFASGNAGMIMGHSLTPAGLAELADDELNLDWVLLPGLNPDQPSRPIVYNGNTVVIPKNADNPEMAKRFLELLMSPEIQAQIPELTGGGSPGINLPGTDVTDESGLLAYVAENGSYVGWAAVTPGALNAVDSKVQAVLTGAQTSAEVGAELDAVRDELRAES